MRTIVSEQKSKYVNNSATSAKYYYHMCKGQEVAEEQKSIFHEKPYYLINESEGTKE